MALPAKNRLRKKKDINSVFKEGSAVKGSFLFIRYRNNNMAFPRFCFIAPAKSFSKAVDRNRIKRVLSEAIRERLKNINNPYDIAIMIRKGKEEDITQELVRLLLKINSWQK